MTTQEIKMKFRSPAFIEAAEVLDMIQRTPDQRSQYELRLKAQRDDEARLQQARAEGVVEGEARGELAGQVKLLRQLLAKEPSSLDGMSNDELGELLNDLKRDLRERGA